MTQLRGFARAFEPNWEGLLDNLMRKGTADRVYNIELGIDGQIKEAIAKRFGLMDGLSPNDPHYDQKLQIAVHRFCGYEYVRSGLVDVDLPLIHHKAEDTAELKKPNGRSFIDEHKGPITNWEQFEKYPWADPNTPSATRELEWYSENLPEDMCIAGGLVGHFCEFLCWLMGYETLCYSLYDQRDLVAAIAQKLSEFYRVVTRRILQFERVKFIWGADDMGFKGGTLISPDDLRKFALGGHKEAAKMVHEARRPYLLHSCGNLAEIMDDLVDDVRIDAKHSYEDTIEDIRDSKPTYGKKISLLGGIDVDFLCRSDEAAIRQRVRDTLDVCTPGGGYCLGTGNSVANYIPVDNYLIMLDEGRLYGG